VLEHGLADEHGNPATLVRQLMTKGATVAIREYQPEHKATQSAVLACAGNQSDFNEVSDDFDHWVSDYAALDESADAERKQLRRMGLHEIRMVIALKRRKAAEAIAIAAKLQMVVDSNPDWEMTPERTLGEVLGMDDASR
jgi:hypothetical protein